MAGLHLTKRYVVASDPEPQVPDTSVCDARRLTMRGQVSRTVPADGTKAAHYQEAERSARLRFVCSFRQAKKLCRAGKLHGFFVDAYGRQWANRVILAPGRQL